MAATVVGGPAVGAQIPIAGAVPADQPSYVLAAEQVETAFVAGYESYSYDDRADDLAQRVGPYVTPALGAVLSGPSQGGPGAALSAEKARASAVTDQVDVESASPQQVQLLATVAITVTSTEGTSVQERYVPLTVVATPAGWKVSDVDSLMEVVAPPPAASGAGTGTTPAPPPAPAPPARGTPAAKPSGAPAHLTGIPDDYLSWYEEASTSCPGLSWTVLAAIGTVESDNGQSSLPGVHSGANYAGAEGPMQFEPATFAEFGMVAPGGASPPNPYDPPDAIWSAARMLCADGAGNAVSLYSAVFDYNHSSAYVSDVLALAARYAAAGGATSEVSEVGLGSVIVRDAESYIGTPYVWGGEKPGVGFDCSGLVQWVFAQAGLNLPRVAQDQYDAGPHLPAGAELYAGDLVFFGSGPKGVEHVGIYVGNGQMVDAPHTGAVVRIEAVAGFNPPFVGATRPEIPDLSAGGPGLPQVVTTAARPGAGAAHGAGPHPHPTVHPTRNPGSTAAGHGGARTHQGAHPGGGDWFGTLPSLPWGGATPPPSEPDQPHHRHHPAGTPTTTGPAAAGATPTTASSGRGAPAGPGTTSTTQPRWHRPTQPHPTWSAPTTSSTPPSSTPPSSTPPSSTPPSWSRPAPASTGASTPTTGTAPTTPSTRHRPPTRTSPTSVPPSTTWHSGGGRGGGRSDHYPPR